MTLTKTQLVDDLMQHLHFGKADAKEFVELFFEELRFQLERGHSVKLSGFGNFALIDKNARAGRNPNTGDNVLIEARRVVVFHPGNKLRLRVSNS